MDIRPLNLVYYNGYMNKHGDLLFGRVLKNNGYETFQKLKHTLRDYLNTKEFEQHGNTFGK